MTDPLLQRKYVYIAGPYSSPDPDLNTERAIPPFIKLIEEGFAPFLPHLCITADRLSPHNYEFWMQYCFDQLRRCDALLRLPGDSPGADREVAFAEELGIPVYYSLNHFLRLNKLEGD